MLAIIGGTGLYDARRGFEIERAHRSRQTPFGAPSGDDPQGPAARRASSSLPATAAGHRLLPHEVNYRANVFALKRAGATHAARLLGRRQPRRATSRPATSPCPSSTSTGRAGARERTFFGGGVAAHVSTAEPVSAALVDCASRSGRRASGMPLHRGPHLRLRRRPRASARRPRAASCARPAATSSA